MLEKKTKQELILVDIARLVLILCVVTIHTGAPWQIVAIGRIGVPFSFALSGYFSSAESEASSVKKNTIRLLRWALLYTPLMIYDAIVAQTAIPHFIQQLLFLTPCYLWFLTALVVCTLLYKITFKVSENVKFIVVIVLYVIGCIGNTYLDLFHARKAYFWYMNVFLTTRNGVFFAPIFYFIGQHLGTQGKLKRKYVILESLVALGAYIAEYYWINHNKLVYKDASMYWCLPILVYFSLRLLIQLNSQKGVEKWLQNFPGRKIRQLSTWIYLSQAGIIRVLVPIFKGGVKLAIPVIIACVTIYVFLSQFKVGKKILKALT